MYFSTIVPKEKSKNECAYMLCIILTLHNPTYKYDPIVNFQVRMVKWLATTSFIKDTVVSQLFLLIPTYLLFHHSLRLFCCVDFFLDDNILCYGKEFEICTTNEILSRRSLIWRKKKNCANSDLPFLTFLLILDEWKPTMHKNDSRDISAWLHFALLII